MSRRNQLTSSGAKVLHLGLLAGTIVAVLVIAGVSWSLGERPLEGDGFVWPLRLVAVGAFACLAILTGVVGRSVTRQPDVETWWRANGQRMVVLWIVAEAVSVLGAILYVFSGILLTLLPLFAGAATLVLQRPTRIVET